MDSAAFLLAVVLVSAPVARSWSTEGHMLTCQIAQVNLAKPVTYVYSSDQTKYIAALNCMGFVNCRICWNLLPRTP